MKMILTSYNWPIFVARIATLLSCAGMLEEILDHPSDESGSQKGTVPG